MENTFHRAQRTPDGTGAGEIRNKIEDRGNVFFNSLISYFLISYITSMVSKIFIITGTSGAGKDSVIEKIKDKNLEFEWVKTTVSRPMREGESQGNPYYFVTPEEFQNKPPMDSY